MSAGTVTAGRRVRAAQTKFDAAHAALLTRVKPISESISSNSVAWILCGGFLAGAFAGASRRVWPWIGAVIGRSAALLGRSLLVPMLAEIMLPARASDRVSDENKV